MLPNFSSYTTFDNISLEREGVKPVDALHVACAEYTRCDYFLTCDDRLIRRYRGTVKAVNPTSFVLIMTEAEEE
jgi:predicted nucleic acid-binding protein